MKRVTQVLSLIHWKLTGYRYPLRRPRNTRWTVKSDWELRA